MKLSILTSAALLFAVAAAQNETQPSTNVTQPLTNVTLPQINVTQTQPAFEKEDGVLPVLGPATPLACKAVTTILNALCSFANYDGCEETIAYTQCICVAQRDKAKVLTCARSELTTLLTGYCPTVYV
ncbi:hypothetical protein BGZ68_006470 [Mortierella alpina]|nr:hypothetical protein BGZ68_006470 [Mortierella alpina]